MRRRPDTADASLLSYLDVLCCGFGGAVFLFLVFAAAAGAAGTPQADPAPITAATGAPHTLVVRWAIADRDAMVRVQLQSSADAVPGSLTGHCLRDDPSIRCDDALRPSSDGGVRLPDAFDGVTMWLWSSRGEEGLEVTLSLSAQARDQLEATNVYLRCDVCPIGGTQVAIWTGWSGEPGTMERGEALGAMDQIKAWPR